MDTAKMEQALRMIPGVVGARVVAGPDGQVLEVHLLARPGRPPKRLVRDAVSCLQVQGGVAVDYRRISVAQLEEPRAEPPRLRLGEICVRLSARGITEVQVQLLWREEALTGTAVGPTGGRERLRLLARATLAALEGVWPEGTACYLEDVGESEVGGRRALMVLVCVQWDQGEERLVGAAYVRRDPDEAMVRATLAAVNRRVGLLLPV